jgi:hypothetical protein
MAFAGGMFKGQSALKEKQDLQSQIRNHLRSNGVEVEEGEEVAGGETDLILPGSLVVENKVCQIVPDPFESGGKFGLQARQYALAKKSRVVFVIVAYRPANEIPIALTESIRVRPLKKSPEPMAEVRIVLPWGYGVPSKPRGRQGKR